jgi:hypothetical protein
MIRTLKFLNLDWFSGLLRRRMVNYHHFCILYIPEFWDHVGLKDRYSIHNISCRTAHTVGTYNIVSLTPS